MSVSEINCADDLADLAREAVRQVQKSKEFRDLIGAVLMANHVADWHYKKDLGRSEFKKADKDAMKLAYPEWDILRLLANGTKHCDLQPEHKSLEWEDTDYWNSPGHVGSDGLDWFVDFDGSKRSVAVLIEDFLDKFADRSCRPK